MSCNNCNNNNCGCNSKIQVTHHKCKPCQEVDQNCECPTILKSDCVTYTGNDLECSGIVVGQTLTETIEQLDTFICEKVDDITNALTLRNIGTGSEVYKGNDLLGRKEIRKIKATGDLVTVTQNTDDISVSIDEDALNEFIEDNQKTYSADNVGSGVEVFKDTTVVGDNTQFNFRSIVKEDLGTGATFLRDIQQNANDLNIRTKTAVSSTLTITYTDEEVSFEIPMTASIPALYVNDLYVPTYNEWLVENTFQNGGTPVAGFIFRGRGTSASPFTNSIEYTLNSPLTAPTITSDTSIQNALDGDVGIGYTTKYSYRGTGTRLAPQRIGEKIVIQDNTGTYNFSGDFGYSELNIEIGGNVNSTITGYIVDMDNATHFNSLQDNITISILEGYFLTIGGDGINNSGTTVATFNFTQSRIVNLIGEGTIYAPNNNIIKYIANSDLTSTGNNNDGNVTFLIDCKLRADYQGIYKVCGVSRLWLNGKLQSSVSNVVVNPALQAFVQLGGEVRMFEGSSVEIAGDRTDAFVFTPTGGFTPSFVGQSPTFSSLGTVDNMFTKTTTDTVNFNLTNSNSATLLDVVNIFESPDVWEVTFNQNYFENGIIDNTKVDVTNNNTISAINTIGQNILEHLRIFDDRADALANLVPLYSAYIKTNGNAYPSTATWVRDIVLPA